MGSILFTSSFGSDDPTRATLPFLGAIAAADAGHETAIALLGEATHLAKDVIVDQIHGVGWPPLSQLMQQVVSKGVSIYF